MSDQLGLLSLWLKPLRGKGSGESPSRLTAPIPRLLSVPLPRLSKVMARFEQHAWVTRRSDPTNGRFTLGILTDLGMEKVVESAPGHVERVQQLVFDPLTPAQQLALRAPLAVAAQELRSLLGDDEAGQTESSKSSAGSR